MILIDFNWNGSHCIVVAPVFSFPSLSDDSLPIILAQKLPTQPLSSLCAMLCLDAGLWACRQGDIMMSAAPAPPSSGQGRLGAGVSCRVQATVTLRRLPCCHLSVALHSYREPVKWHTSALQQTPSTSPLLHGHGDDGPGDPSDGHPDVRLWGPGEHDPVPSLLLPEAQQGAGVPVQGGQHPPTPQAQGVHQCKTGGKN